MRRRSRTALVLLALVPVLAGPALAATPGVPERLAGADRIDTAARVAEATFPAASTPAAVLVSAVAFPDAVTGTGLAGALDGPVLLTWPDRLPERTAQALEALGVRSVHVVGGESAVGDEVLAQLPDDVDVQRVAGEDRYATAAAVARALAAQVPVGTLDGRATALLATGADYPDALAAGPLAAGLHLPVLLVHRDGVPQVSAQALQDLGVSRAVLLGGSAAVGTAVEDELRASGLEVSRLSGADRAQTATAVADALLARTGPAETVLLARGDGFADSLAAGPRGGELGAPVLLARQPDELGPAARAWLAAQCPSVTTVQAVGGAAAVTGAALQAAQDAAESCRPDQRVLTYSTGTRGEVTADLSAFRDVAAAVLEDDRGWDLGGALEFTEVAQDADMRLWLADPAAVAAASSGCSASWSCRVGNDVYINEVRWESGTTSWSSRPLEEYRHYVVNHEVGHWLGLGHTSCPGPGMPAPVMLQQSKSTEGCAPNTWPLPAERDAVRARWAG